MGFKGLVAQGLSHHKRRCVTNHFNSIHREARKATSFMPNCGEAHSNCKPIAQNKHASEPCNEMYKWKHFLYVFFSCFFFSFWAVLLALFQLSKVRLVRSLTTLIRLHWFWPEKDEGIGWLFVKLLHWCIFRCPSDKIATWLSSAV